VDVTTYHYSVSRQGLDASEGVLTSANVASATFGLQRIPSMDGKVDGAPVYLSNLTAGGKAA
jgi:hypothetical protein